jgi:hypothetical protein
MTDEEMRSLRKSIKQETMLLIEKHEEKMNAKFYWLERRLDQLAQRASEIHKGLNIITDKLIDHVVEKK